MRVKNSLINLIYIWGSTLLITILNFVVRRVFLDTLTIDYLGYDGLFLSIFSFLTLSEMGIANIITYHMYSEIATNNTHQIRKLLYMYKLIYMMVGGFVLVAGIIAGAFLPVILKNPTDDWRFIYTIYGLQLIATLCTYFFAYRRILFVTHQKIYVCTTVDTITNIVSICCKMAVLVYLQNYILYLCISIAANLVSNAIIAWKSKKAYPEIAKINVTLEDIRELNLWHDVKNMLATKIAVTVYGSADDIIITSYLGVGMVGMVNNYRMISTKIQEIMLSVFNALQASIGNLVYDSQEEKGIRFFRALDLLGFFMGLVCATAMVVCGQDLILIWLKKENLKLPFMFLFWLSLNVFVALCNNPMVYFRNTLGHFERDRNYMIAAAIVNVGMSFILAPIYGIVGIMAATVIGHLIIFVGRIIVVFEYYIKETPVRYYRTFAFRIVLFMLSVIGTLAITDRLAISLIGIIIKGIISVAVSCLIFIIYAYRSEALRTLMDYAVKVLRMGKKKVTKK